MLAEMLANHFLSIQPHLHVIASVAICSLCEWRFPAKDLFLGFGEKIQLSNKGQIKFRGFQIKSIHTFFFIVIIIILNLNLTSRHVEYSFPSLKNPSALVSRGLGPGFLLLPIQGSWKRSLVKGSTGGE